MRTFAADFFPPNFKDWSLYLREMVVTLHIACGVPFWPLWRLCPWVFCPPPTSRPPGFTSRFVV
jgi:hypothetical protein